MRAQQSATKAVEEAARADIAMKEAEKQAMMAQQQALIAEKEHQEVLSLQAELARSKN